MCGIAGWNLTETPSVELVLTLMAFIEDRGEDSFGFYNGETKEVCKANGAITRNLPVSRLLFKHGFFHTRHATTGAVNAENAHPFEMGDLIGAHNGMIYNHKELNKTHGRKFPVDSQHIFAHIAERLPLSELEGYGAIEYTRDGAYFVAASNGGSLEVALTDKGVLWSSTEHSLSAAIFQAGYKLIHFFRIDEGAVYRVETDNLWETEETFRLRLYTAPKTIGSGFGFGFKQSDSKLDSMGLGFQTETQWERELLAAENEWDGERAELGADCAEITSQDWCHWCGKFGTVLQFEDGSIGCEECAMILERMEDEDEDAQTPEVKQ